MNGINDLEDNTRSYNVLLTTTATVFVEQMDRDNNILKTYTLRNCWPTVIAPIELNFDTVSEVETFDVTWRYTDFTASAV